SVDAQVRNFNLVTQAPVLTVPLPTLSPTPTPTSSPMPRLTFLPPSLTPSPTPSLTPSVTATATATVAQPFITLDPTSGPNHSQITVTGENFLPNTTINISYRTQLNAVGATASTTSDDSGAFQTTVSADDPQGLPGDHSVVVDDGSTTQTATFTQT
ncbi:MAG: hypothetical protein JWO22_2844, partial [Frankiales bacterium]|nr:hypothetical protein [Frankiales bacterium]